MGQETQSDLKRGGNIVIVLLTTVTDMWLEDGVAKRVAEAMTSGAPYITLNGNLIAITAIKALLKPELYKTHCLNSKRNWTCQKGAGHSFDQRCECKDALPPKDLSQQALNAKNDMTPEQQAMADLKAAANREWIMRCKPDWKLAANNEKRQVFVKDYIKNNGKSIDTA